MTAQESIVLGLRRAGQFRLRRPTELASGLLRALAGLASNVGLRVRGRGPKGRARTRRLRGLTGDRCCRWALPHSVRIPRHTLPSPAPRPGQRRREGSWRTPSSAATYASCGWCRLDLNSPLRSSWMLSTEGTGACRCTVHLTHIHPSGSPDRRGPSRGVLASFRPQQPRPGNPDSPARVRSPKPAAPRSFPPRRTLHANRGTRTPIQGCP